MDLAFSRKTFSFQFALPFFHLIRNVGLQPPVILCPAKTSFFCLGTHSFEHMMPQISWGITFWRLLVLLIAIVAELSVINDSW